MRRLALLLLAAIALLLSGCFCDSVCMARTAVNADREYLASVHDDMKARYRSEQIDAVKSVPGDPHDEAVKDKKRAELAKIRKRWAPSWVAYRVAYEAWIAADAIVREQERAWLDGRPPNNAVIAQALVKLAQAIAATVMGIPS